MIFRRVFKRRAKGGIINTVSGITTSDWMTIYNNIQREYNDTAKNHKKPTEYMRGLDFALKALDSIKPYKIAEV